MEGRRVRRFGRARHHIPTLLPLQQSRLSNTISCWYCDFKSTVLNEPLFRFGRKHSRCLIVWFSMGTGFSLAAMLAVVMILLWELGRTLHLYYGNCQLGTLLNGDLFGFSSTVVGSVISLPDIGYICISSIASVLVHEVGHALAAASEGIQMEYVAAFWAVLFPGALVAFNYELLQTLPRVAALRIYCAGIWHNAAACVICALALFLLPLALDPFYTYGDSPMVVNVSPTSPLSTYLSPQDLVLSLNGIRIHTVQDWKEAIALLNKQKPGMFQNSSDFEDSGAPSDKIGYCVPQSVAQESMAAEVDGNRTTCTDEFYAFSAIPCLHLYMLEEANDKDDYPADRSQRKIIYCISPEDVIKLKRCGYSQVKDRMNTLSCPCSEEESCFAPVQTPGLAWAEITYWRTHGCPLAAKDIVPQVKNGDFRENSCIQNFVFVGDIISLGRSLQLTSYRPRWPNTISMYLPGVMERLLIYTFNVSLTLALLNSLPVYYLDGESILELILQHMGFMTPMARGKFLRWFLRVGTFVSVLVFIWSFFLVA